MSANGFFHPFGLPLEEVRIGMKADIHGSGAEVALGSKVPVSAISDPRTKLEVKQTFRPECPKLRPLQTW